MGDKFKLTEQQIAEILEFADQAEPGKHGCWFGSLSNLLGKTVQAIFVDDSEYPELITFKCQDESFSYEVEADCCSHTWISDFFGMDKLIGTPIESIEGVSLEDSENYSPEDGRGTQEEDEIYGYRLRAGGKTSVFAFRNSSNGYYGGNIRESTRETDSVCISKNANWMTQA